MGKFIDLKGKRFSKLTVIGLDKEKMTRKHDGKTYWMCMCDCGKVISPRSDALQNGRTKSCGCIRSTNTYELINNEYYAGCDCNGRLFYIDKEDYEMVSKYRWIVNDVGYVISATTRDGMEGVLLHRYILNAPKDSEIDHINRNPLDCRKNNLRFCSRTQNNQNQNVRKDNSSGVKGVSFLKDKNKWHSRITVNHKTILLGNYDRYEDAVTARMKAEKKYCGEFSYYNDD